MGGNQETLIHTTEILVRPVWSSRLPLQPFIAFHLLYNTLVILRADSRECDRCTEEKNELNPLKCN